MSRVTPEVNTLLNLQVEMQAVRNDAQSHTLTSVYSSNHWQILKMYLISEMKILLNRF